jgi:hypothetical protein
MEQLSVFSFLFLLLWDPFLFFGEFFVLAGWGGGDYGDPLLILSVDDILGFLRHHGFVMPFFFLLGDAVRYIIVLLSPPLYCFCARPVFFCFYVLMMTDLCLCR